MPHQPDTASSGMREKSTVVYSVRVLCAFVPLIFANCQVEKAINYRLAPQYPFPCALQDLVAACTCLQAPECNDLPRYFF
jgi:hypothetical protein